MTEADLPALFRSWLGDAGRDERCRAPRTGAAISSPDHIELWQGREGHLHEREVFDRVGAGWKRVELYP